MIDDYLTCIKKINPSPELKFYPGSPYFAKQYLRRKTAWCYAN